MQAMAPFAPSIEQSTLASVSHCGGRRGGNRGRCCGQFISSEDKDKLWYDHCGRSHHSKDTCWDLHRKP